MPMTDPTIPELVARLRELHNARRYPTEMLVATIRDDQSAQVYATSTGPMRVVRPVAETTVDHADLITETLNALPTLLDALERQPSVDSGELEREQQECPECPKYAGKCPRCHRLRPRAKLVCQNCGPIDYCPEEWQCRDCGSCVGEQVDGRWVTSHFGAPASHSPDGGKVEGPELRRSAIADTGDYEVACSVCHEGRDEPHTWRECAAQLQREVVRLVDALSDVQAPSRALLRQVWQTAHAAGMLVGDKTIREVAEQRERDLDHFLSYPPGSFDEQEARRE